PSPPPTTPAPSTSFPTRRSSDLKPGAIPTLIQELKANPKAGVIGPRLLNPDGTMQLSCYKFPTPARAWLENTWLSAAFPNSPLRSEEHTSELQSLRHLVCRLLLE